jgi:hypothetical protein
VQCSTASSARSQLSLAASAESEDEGPAGPRPPRPRPAAVTVANDTETGSLAGSEQDWQRYHDASHESLCRHGHGGLPVHCDRHVLQSASDRRTGSESEVSAPGPARGHAVGQANLTQNARPGQRSPLYRGSG